MEQIQTNPDETIVYNFDELRSQTDYPASLVRLAIREVIRPIIQDPQRFKEVDLGVGEIVKDVETHGDISNPRLVIIRREMGGVAIETTNKPKNHSEHNGFGRLILQRVFGNDYSSSTDGDLFKGYLFIRRDATV